jgi:hypothetical protein
MTSFLHFASLLLTRWYSFLWLVQRLAVFLEENMVSEYTLALIPLACPKASTASIGVMKGHRVAQQRVLTAVAELLLDLAHHRGEGALIHFPVP